MTKSVTRLRAEAAEYRALAELLGGDAMRQALLESADALDDIAEKLAKVERRTNISD